MREGGGEHAFLSPDWERQCEGGRKGEMREAQGEGERRRREGTGGERREESKEGHREKRDERGNEEWTEGGRRRVRRDKVRRERMKERR